MGTHSVKCVVKDETVFLFIPKQKSKLPSADHAIVSLPSAATSPYERNHRVAVLFAMSGPGRVDRGAIGSGG